MTADLTEDRFLNGRITLWQPLRGYRAAMDPVFLAAAVPAQAGQTVLELGCGAGAASLCLHARVPGLVIHGVERQADYAELARRNAARNGAAMTVTEADLTDLPPVLRGLSVDHVIANPPYFPSGGGTAADDPGRETALREETPLAQWLDTAFRRLRPGGFLTLIQAADRLPEVLAAIAARGGSTMVLPVAARMGRPARRVIVQCRKGAKGPFTLLAPFILHSGDEHERDGESLTDEARAILRDAAPLALPPRAKFRL
ncbi:tRNA1(Val) (adenine(37)-N6)-methyltransferase [Halodurantibacterium flavum]|uniref:tRNA1(Val) (Adenine(37)-N6)-methyltransferase n=1 Tax=Halodurantibacterium flavum TaxID=1382802 RepID=A0ABW4S776_9RHOB